MRHRVFSLHSADSGLAACISEKAKALSRLERRGAWCSINKSAALMRAALSPSWTLPGSQECGSCLPSRSAPRGAGVTLSPPAPPSSGHILPCSLYRDTPHPLHLRCSLSGAPLHYLNKTVPPFNFLSSMTLVFSKLFFTVICTFFLIFLMRTSNHFRRVNWKILTEDAGGKQIMLGPQGKLRHGAVMCLPKVIQNWK